MIDKKLLAQLNECALSTGEPIEGSVYYYDRVRNLGEPDPRFADKRRCLIDIAQKHDRILEIGFNAGHSAALMLSANEHLYLRAIDIGLHGYTELCADVLKQHFGQRFDFIKKSSEDLQASDCADVTAVHCDGDHSTPAASRDLRLIATYCRPGTTVILDDWELAMVQRAFAENSHRYQAHPEYAHTVYQSLWVVL